MLPNTTNFTLMRDVGVGPAAQDVRPGPYMMIVGVIAGAMRGRGSDPDDRYNVKSEI